VQGSGFRKAACALPSYVCVRELASSLSHGEQETTTETPAGVTGVRHFTFSEGSSNKFWGDFPVRCGGHSSLWPRSAPKAKTSVKSFPHEHAAAKHVANLCAEN